MAFSLHALAAGVVLAALGALHAAETTPKASATRPNTAIVPQLNPGFMERHREFVEIARKGDIDLLFLGDSITDWWRHPGRGYTVPPPDYTPRRNQQDNTAAAATPNNATAAVRANDPSNGLGKNAPANATENSTVFAEVPPPAINTSPAPVSAPVRPDAVPAGPDTPFAGKPVFDKYFGALKVANFGIAGDTTQGVLWRLQNGEGAGYRPKAVMLLIGTNNAASNTAPEIAEGVSAVVQELRKDFPAARILLLGIFPRSTPDSPIRAKLAAVNERIAKLNDSTHVFYLDLGPKFLEPDGTIARGVMSDALHPTMRGYEIWARAVKEPLAKLSAGLP